MLFSSGKNNCCSCTQIAIRILRNNKVHFLEFLRTAIKQIHIKKNLRYKKVRFLEFLRKVMKENSFLRLVILISISGIPSVVDLYNVLHKYIILSKCPFCLRQVYLTQKCGKSFTFLAKTPYKALSFEKFMVEKIKILSKKVHWGSPK